MNAATDSEIPQLRGAQDSVPQDWAALRQYLATQGLRFESEPPPRQFAGGFANLNYLIVVDGREAVLRRPPMGPLPPGAYDMGRESKILSRLHEQFPLAPRALHLCRDESVLGAPFQITEYRRGVSYRASLPPALARDAAVCAQLGELLIDVLAQLHRVDPAAVANARAAISIDSATQLVGHFGTYGVHVSAELRRVLPEILRADTRRVGVLIGRDSEKFAASLVHAHPFLAARIRAIGYLAPEEAAAQLAACDLLIQPYPDGVSTRRTSVMAGLALGRPIVTTAGALTEGVWRESQAVALVPAENPAAFIDAAEFLLTNTNEREAYGVRARAFYAAHFALDQTICRLRAESPQLETPRRARLGTAACR